MSFELTSGALPLLNANTAPLDYKPILQVLDVKRVATASDSGGSDRYRLIISDGTNSLTTVLATQMNVLVEQSELVKLAIIQLDQFQVTLVTERHVNLLVLAEITIIGHADEKIGDPIHLGGPSGAGAQPAVEASSALATPAPAPRPAPASIKTPNGTPLFPIEGLSPYQNKWTIKARIMNKSDIKTWSNQRGDGKLFSVTMMDETGEIRATAFNQQVDELFEKLEEGKVYYISKARVGLAKKQFSNVSNEYEITFERNTEVVPCLDAAAAPQIKFDFTAFSSLANVQKEGLCDVIGVVTRVDEESSVISKRDSRNIKKRDITLADRTGFSCRLTLWGKSAESFAASDSPVIAFKGVRVSDFNGRSLSAVSSTHMLMNPDMPEAHALRGWYDSVGQTQTFRDQSGGSGLSSSTSGSGPGASRPINRDELKTIAQVRDENLGMNDEGRDYFTVRGTIVHVKQDNLMYPACGSDACNKKVVQTSSGAWECASCNKAFEEPQYRYILSFSVSDYTGQAWLSAFNETGEDLFEMKAGDLQALKDTDDNLFQEALTKVILKTYNFSCRAKQDTFNDQTRVRYTVNRMYALEFKVETSSLLNMIQAYM